MVMGTLRYVLAGILTVSLVGFNLNAISMAWVQQSVVIQYGAPVYAQIAASKSKIA
jgi:hypothetical protein